jgi:CheY-like chemotaxis protein
MKHSGANKTADRMKAKSATRQILVVDDDGELRKSVCEVLEDAGYEVVTAANGAEALATVKTGAKPSLILLDLFMPGTDGFEFLRVRSNAPELAAIPTILLTAANPSQREGLTGIHVIRKPIEAEELLHAVRRYAA